MFSVRNQTDILRSVSIIQITEMQIMMLGINIYKYNDKILINF